MVWFAGAPTVLWSGKTLSGVNAMVFDNIKKEKLQWLVDDDERTYLHPTLPGLPAALGNNTGSWNKHGIYPAQKEYMNGKNLLDWFQKYMESHLPYKITQ